jgi:GDP-4-dehydro-6-deoxy-D-mannose reductase
VGNLSPRRDFTDVRDVVEAYRLLVELGVPGEAYNVCSGVDLAISELAELMVTMATRPMRLAPDPALQRAVETPVLRGDPSKLHAATGWARRIPLEQTLADVLAEQRNARHTEASSP